jgi:hypothetical protein
MPALAVHSQARWLRVSALLPAMSDNCIFPAWTLLQVGPLGDSEVEIAVTHNGVCHTDIHMRVSGASAGEAQRQLLRSMHSIQSLLLAVQPDSLMVPQSAGTLVNGHQQEAAKPAQTC